MLLHSLHGRQHLGEDRFRSSSPACKTGPVRPVGLLDDRLPDAIQLLRGQMPFTLPSAAVDAANNSSAGESNSTINLGCTTVGRNRSYSFEKRRQLLGRQPRPGEGRRLVEPEIADRPAGQTVTRRRASSLRRAWPGILTPVSQAWPAGSA